MSKVYVVTSGCYSDYGINKIFANREAAEKYCAIWDNKWENPMIEEWDLEDGSNIECDHVYKALEALIDPVNNDVYDIDEVYGVKPFEVSIDKSRLNRYRIVVPINREDNRDAFRKIIWDTYYNFAAEKLGL